MTITKNDIIGGKLTCPIQCWRGEMNKWSGLLIRVTDSSGKLIYNIENKCCDLGYLE
jgi:hypothetical protein